MQKSKLDQFFSIPAAAVLMAVVCNVLWGSAFPFIKLGYRLFAIDSADTASILCFAGLPLSQVFKAFSLSITGRFVLFFPFLPTRFRMWITVWGKAFSTHQGTKAKHQI